MNYYRSGRQHNLLMPVALLSLALSIGLPAVSRARYLGALRKAEPYAIREYGDRKAPLEEDERREWYKDLGVTVSDIEAEPQTSNLLAYIKSAQTRPSQ